MEKIKQISQKMVSTPFKFSLTVNIIAFLICIALFHPFFEDSGDAVMAMIAEGAFGARDIHLINTSVVFGGILKVFAAMIPAVRWMSIWLYMTAFCSLVAIVFVLARNKHTRALALVFVLAAGYELYVSVNIYKTSAVAAAAAYMLIFTHARRVLASVARKMNDENYKIYRNVPMLVLAGILLFVARTLSANAFLLSTLLMIGTGLCEFFWYVGRVRVKKIFYVYVAHFAPVAVLFVAMILVGKFSYTDAAWAEYIGDYKRELVSLAQDHPAALDYTLHGEDLSGLNISENDAHMFLTDQNADDRVFSAETMREISSLDRKYPFDIEVIKAWAMNIYNTMFSLTPIIAAAMFMILMGCTWMRHYLRSPKYPAESFARRIFLICECCACVALFFYLQYANEWDQKHVNSILLVFLAAVMYVMVVSRWEEYRGNTRLAVSVLTWVVMIANVGCLLGNLVDYRAYSRTGRDFDVVRMYMAEDKDKLFVVDIDTIADAFTYDVFKASAEGSLDNMLPAGDWYANAPVFKSIAERFGYENAYDALAGGSILIDNYYPAEKAMFLTQHGDGPRYTAEYLQTVMGYTLFKLY